MDVHLTHESERQLQQFADRTGKQPSQVVEQAITHYLTYEARFLEAVEEGRAAAAAGRLVEHDEVVDRIERLLRS
jgi:predicted transcriptional regulator